MKKLMLSIVFMLFLPCLIFGQAKQTAGKTVVQGRESVIQEITALENAWNEAQMKNDAVWLDRNLAGSFIGTDEEGVVLDKAKTIANAKAKLAKIDAASTENLKVQVYGDAAIATGVNTAKGTYKGKDISGKYPWTDTWIKLGGRWQCVASHNSKLPSK